MISKDGKTIVVVGATGRQGREVVWHLVRDSWRVKGLTREPESKKAAAVRALGAELIQADLDPVLGSEQRGERPVLVVSREAFNQGMTNVTVLPLTSTQRRLYPAEVRLPAGAAGQPLDSIAMAHQVRTISKQRLRRQIGDLRDESLREAIREAIREHFDLR